MWNIKQIAESDHIKKKKMLLEVDHPVTGGRTQIPAFPLKFSGTPTTVERPAPLTGQHNSEVLKTMLGLDEAEIEKLKTDGII